MADIKTRDAVKGTIKTIDKSAVAAERMKDAFIRTKEKADHSYYSAENSPEEYAADRVTGGAEAVTFGAAREFDKHGRKAVQDTKGNISKAKDYLEQRKAAQPQEAAKKAAEKAQETACAAQQPAPAFTGWGAYQDHRPAAHDHSYTGKYPHRHQATHKGRAGQDHQRDFPDGENRRAIIPCCHQDQRTGGAHRAGQRQSHGKDGGANSTGDESSGKDRSRNRQAHR